MYLLSEIANKINGQLIGPDKKIVEISEINNGESESLSFIDNPQYLKYYPTTKCGALIVGNDFKDSNREDISLIKVSNPRLGLLKAIKIIYKNKLNSKISKSNRVENDCYIDKSAIIGENLCLGKFSSISHDVSIGNNVIIGDNCSISHNVSIGDNVKLHNNVIIEKDCIIGNNSIIQSGTVVGSDGFGTVKDKNNHLNFPHIGNVIIGEDVWIGSNVSIDRGTNGDTIIGNNTKID